MDRLAEKLKITDMDAWYKIPVKMIAQHGGLTLIEKYDYSLSKLLTALYPSYLSIIDTSRICYASYECF